MGYILELYPFWVALLLDRHPKSLDIILKFIGNLHLISPLIEHRSVSKARQAPQV